MIADLISNKKSCSIVIFVRGRELSISTVFITQFKIPNKREIKQIAYNHVSDIEFKDFMNLYKKCTAKPHSFLAIESPLPSENFLRFRCNLLEKNIKTNHDNWW